MRIVPVRAALALRAPALGLVGLLLAGPAFAGAPKPAGKVEIAGVVEVPLYGGLATADPFHYVEMTVGEHKLLMRLATGHRDVLLTDGTVTRLGLKKKGKEGEEKVKVDAASIGAVSLSGVAARVGTPEESFEADGELGLDAFPQMAWAVLPSQGVVRFAPAASGAELVGQVGGQVLDYHGTDRRKEKIGTEKVTIEPSPYIVTVKWSGVPLDTELTIQVDGANWIPAEVEAATPFTMKGMTPATVDLPDAPTATAGVRRHETRDVEIAGVTSTVAVSRGGLGPLWFYQGHAQLSQDVLGTLDLAVDPVAHKIAMKPAGTVKRADWAPTHEAHLRKALVAEGEDGAAPTEKQVQDARKGGISDLADFLWMTGRHDESVELARELTRLKPEACTSWLDLGTRLLHEGKAQDAVDPLTRAMDQYQPWSKLPLAERLSLAEEHGKAQADESAWDGPIPQDHACHVAPGRLALARVLTGDVAAVDKLYPAYLDLDPGLPMAAGIAALKAGKPEAAEAAFRQAAKLTIGEEADDARAGLFLAIASRDPALAQAQLARVASLSGRGNDPLVLRSWAQAVGATQGAAAAVAALKALTESAPEIATFQLEYGRALAAAGDAAGAQRSWEQAAKNLDEALRLTPRHEGLLVQRAMVHAVLGQAADAQRIAADIVKANPTWGPAWIAQADAAEAAGDAAKAAEYRKRAGVVDPENPLYARLALQ